MMPPLAKSLFHVQGHLTFYCWNLSCWAKSLKLLFCLLKKKALGRLTEVTRLVKVMTLMSCLRSLFMIFYMEFCCVFYFLSPIIKNLLLSDMAYTHQWSFDNATIQPHSRRQSGIWVSSSTYIWQWMNITSVCKTLLNYHDYNATWAESGNILTFTVCDKCHCFQFYCYFFQIIFIFAKLFLFLLYYFCFCQIIFIFAKSFSFIYSNFYFCQKIRLIFAKNDFIVAKKLAWFLPKMI